MNVTHLIGTNFFGGPERQILNHALRVRVHGITPQILSFAEHGKSNELLRRAAEEGIVCSELGLRSPFHPGAVTELAGFMKSQGTDLLVGHGYKANVVGRLATWCTGIPFLAVSRGWTGESRRIRFYEFLDRLFLRLADAVVAVSEGQRQKVIVCGVRADKVRVIHNAIDLECFPGPAERGIRAELNIPGDAVLVVTAGRLSPEKNHLGLVQAAKRVLSENPDVYFVIFGEGFCVPIWRRPWPRPGSGIVFSCPAFATTCARSCMNATFLSFPPIPRDFPMLFWRPSPAASPWWRRGWAGHQRWCCTGRAGFWFSRTTWRDLPLP